MESHNDIHKSDPERNIDEYLRRVNIREAPKNPRVSALVSLFGVASTALSYMGTKNAEWYAILSLVFLAVFFVTLLVWRLK
jgi:hypothetical protein